MSGDLRLVGSGTKQCWGPVVRVAVYWGPGATIRPRLPISRWRTANAGSAQSPDKALTAWSTSHGNAARPSTWAKGPSDSVSTRSRGIFAASARPFSPPSMVGPTLNQQPRLTARASSRWLPENQCQIGVPAPGCLSRTSSTAVVARRLWRVRMRPPASVHVSRILVNTVI